MKRFLLTLAVLLVLLIGTAAFAVYRAPLWVADLRIRLHLRSQHVRSNYLQVHGNTVHYFEALPSRGNDNGLPILLIHGLGGRGEDWSGMIPTLAASGFHVYAIDLLGYGRSARPDIAYSIAEQESLIVDFLHAVHIDRTDVAGWSMGGWVALRFTVDHPTLVRRLVVMDSAGIYFPASFDASLFAPTGRPGLDRLIEKLTPTPMHLPGFVAQDAIRKFHANAWIIRRSLNSMTGGRDLLDFQLTRISKPTLIVWGQQDNLIPLAAGESMHRKISGSNLLVVQGCGHLAPAECTQPILENMVAFLRSFPPERNHEATVAGH